MNKQRSKKSKLVALLLSFAMLITMFPSGMFAAAGDAQDVTGGVNGFQATLQADADTSEGYKTAFGNTPNAAYNGKVWADKSVNINEDGKTFDVTLSALGQTFATTTTTQTEVAFDVVFVVDRSGSMNFGMSSWSDRDAPVGSTRMDATVDALNSAADVLMENENNRMAVVTFNSDANTFVPLNHYDKNNRQKYFSYGDNNNRNLHFRASGQQQKDVEVTGGTNQQDGYFKAGDILEKATIPENSPTRIPVVIMLTDGEPDGGGITSNYKEGTRNDGSTPVNNVNARDYYYTICTAAYTKDQITDHYKEIQDNNEQATAKFYTIGLALAQNSNAGVMLDPSKRNMSDSNEGIFGGDNSLSGTINDNLASKMGFSNYNYADESFVGEMDADRLQEIFNSIIGSITSITGGASVGEEHGNRNSMHFYETLGDGVSFTGEATLTVPTYTVNEGVMTKGESRVYELQFVATDTKGGVTEGTVLTGENGPAYIEAGGVAKAEAVSVNGSALDVGNAYDKSVRNELDITVRQLENGKRQMNYYIPPQLMAYNVLNTTDEGTTYFESEPIQLTYGVQLRNDTDEAGSYLIGEPGQTYMEFYPSTVKNEDGTYQMPYYNPGGQFENDQATIDKDGTGIAGADNYISSTQFLPSNSVVRIDLGNNGLYTIDGKAMTFHLFWNDANDQDDKRPATVTMQLYREAVKGESTDQPQAPNNPEKYGDPITLGLSNVAENDANMWEFTTDQLPVYDNDGNIYRYWAQITNDDLDNYTVTKNDSGEHQNGYVSNDGKWLCFSVAGGLLADAKLDIKLSYEPATVTYNVVKDWDASTGDAKDTENSVSVQLYANGQAVNENGTTDGGTAPFTIEKDGTQAWEKTLTLPKYKNGEEVLYSFVEQGDKYTALVDYGEMKENQRTVTITNYASLDKTTLTAVKEWSDGNDQDGIRPESVKLKLTAKVNDKAMSDADLANLIGVEESALTQTVNADSEWLYTWKDLPKQNAEGQAVSYSAEEVDAPDSYVSSFDDSIAGYVFITNEYIPETTELTITKTWNDSDNQDGLRPSTISGTIYKKVGDANELIPVSSYVVDKSWNYSTSELPAKENGQTLTYYVTENAVNGYTTSASTKAQKIGDVTAYPFEDGKITLTNTHEVSTQDYTATFTWDDKSPATRPNSITVNLTATVGGESKNYELTLNVQDGTITSVSGDLPGEAKASVEDGQLKITGLPMSNGGKTVYYSMGNAQADGYTTAITGTTYNSTSFTLTRVDTPISLGFTKVWDDTDNEGMRPSTSDYAQYLTLKADGATVDARPTITEGDLGTYTVTYGNLNQYNDEGKAIVYTVEEAKVPNYTSDETTVTLNAENTETLTNTFKQEVYEDDIVVTKVWDDADGKDKRPELPENATGKNDPLDVQLKSLQTASEIVVEPVSVTADGDEWTYTFKNVPSTNPDGTKIDYQVVENRVPTGYSVNDDVIVNDGTVDGTLTNTLDGGAVATGNLTIEKKWVDKGFENNRSEVTVEVLKQVEGGNAEIIATKKLNEGNNWTTTLDDQPITSGGKDITYSVRETKVPAGYTASMSDPVKLTKDGATLTVTNTYNAEKWTVTYNGNGGTTDVTDDQTYTSADNEATVKAPGEGTVFAGHVFLGWSTEQIAVVDSAENVPEKLLKAGDTIELKGNTTLYAVWAIDANNDGKPDYDQMSNVTVNVVWKDDGNRCGIRPTDISFTLKDKEYTIDLANSEDVRVNTNDGNTMWIYTVQDVFDKNAAPGEGDLTSVTVNAKAHADANDTAGYTQDGITWDEAANAYTITLSHTPETTTHDVTKTWDFGKAGFTVGTAEIQLLANGQPAVNANGEPVEPITFDSNGDKDLTWSNLPKYEGGQLITYHAIETQVLNGQDDVTAHFNVDYDWSNANQTVMTNTYSELRNITLLYTWDDDNDAAGERPTSVTVQLYNADTDAAVGDPATITADTQWSTTWEDLPIYDVTTQESDIATLAAGDPINYEARVISYVDNDGTHTVTVDSDDSELTESNYSFDVVSFGQDSVFVMNSALDDLIVTATKTWEDADNAYNTRPESIYISLMQDGNVYQTKELKDGATQLTWDNLPAGHAYTVQEVPVSGYTVKYDGTNITNTLNDLADRDEEYTVTFVYEHASATDADGNAITAPITVKHDGSLQFTAKADSGYILQTPSYNGSATMEANGSTYTLKNIKSDVTVTIKAEKQNQGGGGGGIIITPPDDKPELERGDHFAYIVGYEDETIRPQNNITRAEVATIFFRLLTDESREQYFTDDNSAFSDMTGDHWYDNAVATLTNAGIIAGYPDGTFRPNDPITRAEFAAIATRFDDLEPVPSRFTDIDGHWAEDAINAAYGAGWVGGYPDGTFLPNKNITRAEVMSLVNRVLDRNVDIDGMLDDMLTWVDNEPSDWFYEAVQEATNSHDYEREEGEEFETWTKITEPRDWTQLEKDLLAGLDK